MDAAERNRRVAAFEEAGRRERPPGPQIIQPGGVPGFGIHLAYCKVAAGTGTTIAAFLDTDSTGTEIEVNVPIYGPQATHNLNASSLKNLADGTEIQVFFADKKWRFNGSAFDIGPCPEQA